MLRHQTRLIFTCVRTPKSRKGPRKGAQYNTNHPYEFGRRLSGIRRKKGLSQPELAQKMGTSKRMVSHWEREVEKPYAELIHKLAQVLDVPEAAFLRAKAAEEVAEVPAVIRALKQRLPKLPTLTRKEQENLVGVIDGLLAKHSQEAP
jgi:transcriptional regulator with XRE-family HTH domain